MNKVNLGSNYNHRITLRLNEEQYEFIIKVASILGVSPSDYLRMSINSGMIATKKDIDTIADGNVLKGMVGTDENVKTDINDIV